MITRRGFLRGAGAAVLAVLAGTAYAFGVEPGLRLRTQHWKISPPNWRRGNLRGRPLRIVAVADPHMGEPHMPLSRLEQIVARANVLEGDVTVLLGDYAAGHRFVSKRVDLFETARILSRLEAREGVYAILGNHDWWDDAEAQRTGHGPVEAQLALEAASIPVLENRALRIGDGEASFWLAGLGDQYAFYGKRTPPLGVDDLPGTLGQITDDAPVILLAHEPDIFPQVPDRVALTLSGHTHGGQVRLFGWSPIVPSRFGNRYAYGHIREGARDIVVSGGLGCSILPVRFGMPPEITVIDIT